MWSQNTDSQWFCAWLQLQWSKLAAEAEQLCFTESVKLDVEGLEISQTKTSEWIPWVWAQLKVWSSSGRLWLEVRAHTLSEAQSLLNPQQLSALPQFLQYGLQKTPLEPHEICFNLAVLLKKALLQCLNTAKHLRLVDIYTCPRNVCNASAWGGLHCVSITFLLSASPFSTT